jgi:hypothetical protein
MAVTITDRRTTINDAQATTNWTGAGYGTTDVSAEDTLAVAESLAISTGQVYYTGTSRNLGTSPGTLVYIWSFNNALQDAWDASPPPNALMLGDGTDRIAFDMAGADRRVFNHLEGPAGLDCNSWQCLVLDTGQAGTMNSAGNTYVVNGSYAGLNFAAVTQFGVSFDTNSKALGGGYNVAVDIIRFGNDGIRLTAGTTGDRGTFAEIATADRSRSADAAHGILREYTTIAFGCQGPLTFGDSGAATTSYFEESGSVLVFEDRNISNDKYYLNVEGNSGSTNLFILTGCTVTSAGPHVGIDMSGGNIDTLTLDGCVFRDLGDRPILFSSNADASGHDITDCTFDNTGKITVGDVDFLRNNIINSAATDNALIYGGGIMTDLTVSGYEGTAGTAAILSNENVDMDGELDRLSATKGTAATHALEFGASTPASITLRDCDFSGYNASDGNNDSTFYNNTGGALTINIVGGSGNVTYRNGTNASTSIVQNPVTLEVTTKKLSDQTALGSCRVLVYAGDGTGPLPFQDSVTITRVSTTASVSHTGHGLANGNKVLIQGADQWQYNGVFAISNVTANAYDYTIVSDPGSNGTGTIVSTGVIIDGDSNATTGVISDTRTYSTDQPIAGRVRKSTSSPYYKTAPVTGTISSANGLSLTVLLQLDE